MTQEPGEARQRAWGEYSAQSWCTQSRLTGSPLLLSMSAHEHCSRGLPQHSPTGRIRSPTTDWEWLAMPSGGRWQKRQVPSGSRPVTSSLL